MECASSGDQQAYVNGIIQRDGEKACNGESASTPVKTSSAIWTRAGLHVLFFLVAVYVLHEAIGGEAKELALVLNDMFDRVWCPLPTWAHVVLVLMAWTLFFRVAKDFAKIWK